MTETENLVTDFIELLKTERPLFSEALNMLTLTQQNEHKFIGGVDVKATINGLYGVVRKSKAFTVSEKISTNQVMKDVKIKIIFNEDVAQATGFKQRKLICRCVKESDLRKTDINGAWGINASSFKFTD